ncbi:MAG: hypothetical protein C0493_07760 [Kytococcus sp.]|nr:hypothetical protein [Kytococcus sp.]
MAAARRRRLTRGGAALLLAAPVLLPGLAVPTSAMSAGRAAEPGDARITITSITPVVDGDGTATVRGRVTNTGNGTLEDQRMALVVQPGETDRAGLDAWAEGEEPVLGTALDTTSRLDVPSGGSTPFALTVDGADLLPGTAAGAVRLSVQTEATAVHTFLGVHRAKEYEPLRMVWGLPLLLPGDRELFGESGTTRTQTWQEAVGPDSRLARLTADPPGEDEAWLLDPALLDVPQPSEDSGVEDTGISEEERTVRAERAATLRRRLVASRTLVLPDADADVAAGAASPEAHRLVGPRVKRGTSVARGLGARSDVMWPADGLVTGERASALYQLRPSGNRPTVLVPDTSLQPGGFTPTGGTRTSDGTPLVVSDSVLSDLVSDLESTDDVPLARQRLVAETAELLGERPGTSRTVLVVPDRDSQPEVDAWQLLRDGAGRIPWLEPGSLSSVLAESAQADPTFLARTPGQIAEATKGDPAPAPLLTPERARRVQRDERAMATFASVRSDGTSWRRVVQPALHQLTSTRWRSDSYDFIRLHRHLHDAVTLARDDLVVSSGDVNFFADTGRLQITVINNTDVELSNLVVRLTPRNPSLRIDAPPDPVTIGPGGRQTVTVQASALAAGQVPVDVGVTTPAGHRLSAPATLHVRVRPTGDSIYWLVGGAAVLLLAAGTWRSVRGGRRSPTATARTTEPEGHDA